MQNSPMISVIVPVYNVERYLERCIDSLVVQSYSKLQILLIDDGSSDNSSKICDRYAEKFPNLIYVCHKENGGLSSARNAGLRLVKGDYISFIDSDDYVESSLFQDAMEMVKESETDILTFGRFDDSETGARTVSFASDGVLHMDSREAMRRILTWDKMDIAAWDKIYKAELFDGVFFPEGRNNEDICTIPKIIHKAKAIAHMGLPYYHYFHRAGSITTTITEKAIDDLYCAVEAMKEQIRDLYSDAELDDELNFYINRQYLIVYRYMTESGYKGEHYHEVCNHLKKNWWKKCSNSRMSTNSKIMYFLLRTKLYKPMREIKQFLKGRFIR